MSLRFKVLFSLIQVEKYSINIPYKDTNFFLCKLNSLSLFRIR